MFEIFITPNFPFGKWCTFSMALEDLLISTIQTTGGSFIGAAIFWYIQCPNKRCCQMHAVHKAVERTQEMNRDGS